MANPTKAQWEQYKLDITAWEKDQLDPFVTAVKNMLIVHHSDPPSTELAYPGSNPSSPPPPPPAS